MHISSRASPVPFDELLQQAQGGCAESVGQLFESCRGYLLVVANRQLNNALQAKLGGSDLVQQTLLHAHREFAQFRGQSERELLAWLNRILLNAAARAHRDYRSTAKRDLSREVPLDPSDVARHGQGSAIASNLKTPSHYARAREDQDRLRLALANMDESDRRIIELRNRDLLTFVEIGARLEISTETARRAWAAAVERLRAELIARGET